MSEAVTEVVWSVGQLENQLRDQIQTQAALDLACEWRWDGE